VIRVAAHSSIGLHASRCVAAFLAVLFLAGCGEGTVPPGGPLDHISASFGALNDVVVVSAVDRLPLRSAVLVDPDGERIPAYSLDVSSSPSVAVSIGEQAMRQTPGSPYQVTNMNAMVATALIRLPDPTRYAKTWQQWRVEVTLGDPGSGGRDLTLPAPAPKS
jgi:hypothetical protein